MNGEFFTQFFKNNTSISEGVFLIKAEDENSKIELSCNFKLTEEWHIENNIITTKNIDHQYKENYVLVDNKVPSKDEFDVLKEVGLSCHELNTQLLKGETSESEINFLDKNNIIMREKLDDIGCIETRFSKII